MKPRQIIQNCEVETAGTIVEYLNERQLAHGIVRSDKGQELPNIEDIEAVIYLG